MAEIEARITGVQLDQGTGWYRIIPDHPTVKKLETKKSELAEQAAELMKSGTLARISYTEKPSTNVNPHTNQPYLNRYFDGALPIAAPATSSGIEVVEQTGRKTNPTDAWRICLAAGGKLAVATLPMMPVSERGFEVQKRIAIAWAEFFFFSQAPSQPSVNGGNPTSLFQAPAGSLPAFAGPGADEPPHDPNDIPF